MYLSIKFCLSNSLQTDTNSFLTPAFPAALFAISISSLSTSAIASHGEMMVGSEGVISSYRDLFHPKLVLICASISSFCGFRHCFSLMHLLNALFQHHYFRIIIIIPLAKVLSSEIVATISFHSLGVPTYSLPPAIILFSFIFVSFPI